MNRVRRCHKCGSVKGPFFKYHTRLFCKKDMEHKVIRRYISTKGKVTKGFEYLLNIDVPSIVGSLIS